MSAATIRSDLDDREPTGRSSDAPEIQATGTPVVVRRNAGLAALVGAGASAVAIAYLWRAATSGAVLDWVLCGVMAAVALLHLAHLVDARTSLLVADDLGVRVRLGNHWRGLPWEAVASVAVRPRRGLVRDGRLVLAPRSVERSLDGLDRRGRRVAALNRRLYGAPLAVPLGLGTRVSPRRELAAHLARLAGERTDVAVEPGTARRPPAPQPDPDPGRGLAAPVGPGPAVDLATPADGAPRPASVDADRHPDSHAGTDAGTDAGSDAGTDAEALPSLPTVRAAVRLRAARRGLRAQVTRETPATVHRNHVSPVQDVVRPADGSTGVGTAGNAGKVRAIAELRDPVDPLVVDDYLVEPAPDPVIGPELAAARTRVGLSVDELAERTRIRPHVIESIEVDDFAPCGGDFYARGHLRTLARVLGRDPVPLLQHFDNRYASAPINARRVFEAELATGMTSAARRSAGGPGWILLAGVVLALALTWAVVRLFEAEPTEQLRSPVAGVTGPADAAASGDSGVTGTSGYDAAGAAGAAGPGKPVTVALLGTGGGSPVVVRGRSGGVLWAGELAAGERRTLQVTPPVQVRAQDAGGVTATLDGRDQGTLGPVGQPVSRVFQRPAAR